MATTMQADWIAVDWGTSNLRAYAMQGGSVVAQRQSSEGMAKVSPDAFEPALDALLQGWGGTDLPVVACGMVGARQGWVEAPYREVPCAPLGGQLTQAPSSTERTVHVISGLSQSHPADVMRGEETQIAGFLALNPGWDGVLCLPGTHTKWVHLSAGEVVSFQTFMTGELYALLSNASVLRHTVTGNGWDQDAFDQAVDDTISRPERLAARLFSIRATDLLGQHGSGAAASALSGYLIGAELASARAYWLGQNVAILGQGEQARAYEAALRRQAVTAMLTDADRATVAGLTAAYRLHKEKL